MFRLLLPLFESVLASALHSDEFRAWLIAIDGPGAVAELERIRQHAERHCQDHGW